MNIPQKIVPGDAVTWTDKPFQGLDPATGLVVTFTPEDYELSYAIRGSVAVDLTAVEVDGDWRTSLNSAASGTLTEGGYFWQSHLTNAAGDRVTVGSGSLQVSANFASVLVYDGRSTAKKQLDAVNATIEARLSGGAVQRYKIGTRELERDTLSELFTLRDKLRVEVAREERASKGLSSKIFIRFGQV